VLTKIKAGLQLSRAADRLKEASMKGKLISSLYGLGTFVVAGVVSQVRSTCPGLIENLWPLAGGAIVAGIALFVQAPSKGRGLKATLLFAGTCLGTAAASRLTTVCPAVLAEGWSIVTVGAAAGLGLYLRSPKETAAAPAK
jgi:hypothetical protein